MFCTYFVYKICTKFVHCYTKSVQNMYIVKQNMYNKIYVVDTIGLQYNIKNVYNIDTR